MDTSAWTAVGFLVVAMAGFAASIPFIRTGRASATIKLQEGEITARDVVIERFHKELSELEERCKEREVAQERRHVEKIGELNGRIEAMTSSFAAQVAEHLYREGVRAGSSGSPA